MKKFVFIFVLLLLTIMVINAQESINESKQAKSSSTEDLFSDVQGEKLENDILTVLEPLSKNEMKKVAGEKLEWRSIGGGAAFAAGAYTILTGRGLYKDINRHIAKPTYIFVKKARSECKNWKRWTYHGSW